MMLKIIFTVWALVAHVEVLPITPGTRPILYVCQGALVPAFCLEEPGHDHDGQEFCA